MNTKTLAVIIIFAALAIVLNPSLSSIYLPAPYAPYLIYQIWEIPIVAAFLLYGSKAGIPIAIINTLALIALFPGALPTGPLYNLAAVLSMLFGIGIVKTVVGRHSPNHEAIVATLIVASGAIFRTVIMALVNYACLRYPPPVGYSLPEEAIVASIPLVSIFNITIALYTIVIGYLLARAVKAYVKT